ncbi:MarR family winged helix-turn-helix transcriptional regulator [Terrimonas sp. NA20]|uniref:MarR family winged helix-turn-helix transcriptional regulator n=1 Tax=Terrimonas ginsenosidimutans TaxID=2908004 RepID=A0ABS9KSM5_9BACT|nr:MarR family winged helix-turn-helix transcriptional regulator [Terrimonas ginsenosidimutans]MCG2615287.1 MarR family winged helix-turn-helix transcriptional regulator [Terrimonas ginsenosidimutans]
MKKITSPFNINLQHESVDSQIMAALERLGESLRILLSTEAREHGLSPIQAQVIIFLHTHSPEKNTLSYLAKEFSLTKATLSDVIKVLVEKDLVQRKESPSDARSQTLALTPAGKKIAVKCGQFATPLLAPVGQLSQQQKLTVKHSLFTLIHSLYQQGVITIQRMCYTCVHFSPATPSPFCNLLKIDLTAEKLRLDCPEHEEKKEQKV